MNAGSKELIQFQAQREETRNQHSAFRQRGGHQQRKTGNVAEDAAGWL